MPEVKGDKYVILIIKPPANFRLCMKPIHRAESIKYIVLVSITIILRGMSEYARLRLSGIIIAHAGSIKLTVFLRNQELIQYRELKKQFKVVYCKGRIVFGKQNLMNRKIKLN